MRRTQDIPDCGVPTLELVKQERVGFVANLLTRKWEGDKFIAAKGAEVGSSLCAHTPVAQLAAPPLFRVRNDTPAGDLGQRPEQSGFTPGRSTVDRVLSLRLLAEMRREYRKPLYAAYVDLKQAFDSVDRQCLWKVLRILGVPSKLLDLLSLLYSDTTSCVRVNGQTSDPFTINSGVRQGCVLAPTIFNTAIDHVMAKTVSQSSCGASFGSVTISDLDYADDVAILAEVVQVLKHALEAMNLETQPLGLMISWGKTKVQSLSDFQPPPAPPVIDSHEVEVVNKFNYLGSTITSDCKSSADIRIRVARAATAMANLSKIWSDRRLSVHTKLRLYNSLVLSILLYGAEAWTLTSTQERHLDAFDAKCLRRILGIRWYDRVTNIALRRSTNQPPVSQKIRAARLRLFGHLARSSPPSEPARLLLEPTPTNWTRPRGRPRQKWLDVLSSDLRAAVPIHKFRKNPACAGLSYRSLIVCTATNSQY
ncbi:hypothetical protein Bbelb_399820 [Branchiostoma belcheri]|nr:hypothetical protein Bbelb_399820 [Branchiostoma belcheri]